MIATTFDTWTFGNPHGIEGGHVQTETADEASSKHATLYAEDFPKPFDGVEEFLGRQGPRRIQVYAAVVAFLAGAVLCRVVGTGVTSRALAGPLLYNFPIVAMFAVVATITGWPGSQENARKWMKAGPDHSMIFVFIAGSYTQSPCWNCRTRRDGCCSDRLGRRRSTGVLHQDVRDVSAALGRGPR